MGVILNGITNGLRTSLAYNFMSSFLPFCGGFWGSGTSAPIMFPGTGYNFFQMPDFNMQMPSFNWSLSGQQSSLNNFSYNFIDFSNYSSPNTCIFSSYTNFTPNWNMMPINFYTPTFGLSRNTETDNNKSKFIPTRTANELYEKWSKKPISKDAELTPEFCEKVIRISKNIKCDPDDLMALMYHESKFSPKAENKVNKGKNAGLIQFGAASRTKYFPGMSAEESFDAMLKTNAMKQLDFVESYFINSKKQSGFGNDEILTTNDIAALAFGSSIGKKEVLATEGTLAYKNNKDLDKNGDKKITKTELGNRLRGFKA